MNKFYLTTEIDNEVAQEFCNFVEENQNEPELTVYIDSVGGDVFAGLRMIKAIENSKVPVIAECGILVASIAAIIALSCSKLEVSKDTFMMIHKPWCEAVGNAEDFLATASLLEQAGKHIEEIVTANAKEAEKVTEWFNQQECWFGRDAILENFTKAELKEDMKLETVTFNFNNKLKKAPDELVTLVAKLQEEKTVKNEKAKEILNKLEKIIL